MSIDTVRYELQKAYEGLSEIELNTVNYTDEEVVKQNCAVILAVWRIREALAALSTIDHEAIRREAGQAAYDHAAVFHRRLVAAQDALVAYPAIVTKLVRGYGIDVNEHQIESWLNDQLAAILGAEPAKERNDNE